MSLLERTPFLSELHALLRRAEAGQGSLVLVGGEAGIGKTALVRRFREHGAYTTRSVLGLCDPLSTPRPLGPLLDIAKDLDGDGELARLAKTALRGTCCSARSWQSSTAGTARRWPSSKTCIGPTRRRAICCAFSADESLPPVGW